MAAEAIATIPVDGAQMAYRRLGNGRSLLVLNGLAATSADWDPSFIDRLASANDLVLLDNRGIGASTDDGAPFTIAKLAADTAQAIEALDLGTISVLGWSMGGFIAQTVALDHPNCVHKLILLSTDPGGADAELSSSAVRAQLTDTSGTPHEQARRLLFLLFPKNVAESIYREFGDIVAAARAQLAPELFIGSPSRWMPGIAMVSATGSGACARPRLSRLAPRTSSSHRRMPWHSSTPSPGLGLPNLAAEATPSWLSIRARLQI